jgi:hypothetical protein
MAFTPSSLDRSLQPLFKLQFDKLPNVTYMSYSVSLPSVSLNPVLQPTPFRDRPMAGGKLNFDPLTLNYIVQENLANYIELLNWMNGIGLVTSGDNYAAYKAANKDNIYSDAKLTILSGKYNPLVVVTFVDCWPTNIGALAYDAQTTEATTVTSDATFAYSYYTVESL